MKKIISILCIAALLISLFCLSGCGISGTYKMTKLNDGIVELSMDDLEETTMVISGNKATITGEHAMITGDANIKELTVDSNAKKLTGGKDEISYTVEGDTLILEKEGSFGTRKIVLEKQK